MNCNMNCLDWDKILEDKKFNYVHLYQVGGAGSSGRFGAFLTLVFTEIRVEIVVLFKGCSLQFWYMF